MSELNANYQHVNGGIHRSNFQIKLGVCLGLFIS